MSLPQIYEVMRRIDKIKSLPNKMYMRAEFEFCARGIELAGQLTSTDRKRHTLPYGPTGKQVTIAEIDPPPVPPNQMLSIILTALGNKEEAIKLAQALSEKIKIGAAPIQAGNYAELNEAWPRYIHKLCIPFNYQAFGGN